MDAIPPISSGLPPIARSVRTPVKRVERITRERDRPEREEDERKHGERRHGTRAELQDGDWDVDGDRNVDGDRDGDERPHVDIRV
ncbi:MAG TPA: hypothetical protein VK701_01165 [Solirubrobacteraceae bacterium]|jgi:hypothetical protein|nr:hypothetical protein [Solirubrobacteraceae bacterium]